MYITFRYYYITCIYIEITNELKFEILLLYHSLEVIKRKIEVVRRFLIGKTSTFRESKEDDL